MKLKLSLRVLDRNQAHRYGAPVDCPIENINFSSLPVFRPANGRDVEVRPNWFLLVDTEGKRARHRLIPMNGPVRAALQKVIDSRTIGNVFDYKQTGVSASTLRCGFEKACDRARIPFGLTVEGGVIWHDLRRTFATELRGRQVHGHTIQRVTGTNALSTPEALEDAVNRLTEPRGSVSQFKRRAS